MARYRGTTAERGLGSDHQADRRRLLALHRDGDPCWRCGQPMYKSQPLDRDHIIDRALGGAQGPAVLAHRWCNRAAGARLGNQLQPRKIKAATNGRDAICTACGKPYSRAPRRCEICGAHYHPNHGEQRSCSRACGVELRRRKYGSKLSSKPPVPSARSRTCDCPPGPHKCFTRISYRNCVQCGGVFVGRNRITACSAECQVAYQAAYMAEYRHKNQDKLRAVARAANDRKGEARGWPRGKGAYNVGSEPWNKRASREW